MWVLFTLLEILVSFVLSNSPPLSLCVSLTFSLFLTKTLLGRTICCLKCVSIDSIWVLLCCLHLYSAANVVPGVRPALCKVTVCSLNETAQSPNLCTSTIFSCTRKVVPV